MDIRLLLSSLAVLYFICICIVFSAPVDPPKDQNKKSEGTDGEHEQQNEKKIESEIDDLGLEYGRYLQQVVEALEEDKEFARKLENVSQEEIKNGAIARELNFVSHSVRNRLDELKRIEMDRLRQLAKKERHLEQMQQQQNAAAGGGELAGGEGGLSADGRRWRTLGADSAVRDAEKIDAQHLDHVNPHSFEAEDLQKLILTATKDLEELDAKRREDFKQYEMEKELRYRDSMTNMTQEERQETEKKHQEMVQKHKQHPKVHHPGSKKQLEQVWEEQDRMPREEFNPKVFFTLHDVNGDGFLDPEEVEAILSLEIRKMYSEKNAEDDPNEMQEEYHRMREHIYKEADVNRDGLISKKEFLDFTHRMEFERDDGWKALDDTQVYNDDDLRRYQQHREQMQRQNQQYGAYQQYQQQYYPPGYHPDQQQQQYHPGQHPGQQQQYHPAAAAQQQAYGQAVHPAAVQAQQQQQYLAQQAALQHQQQQQQQQYYPPQQHAPQQVPQHDMHPQGAAPMGGHAPQQQQYVLQQPNPQLHQQVPHPQQQQQQQQQPVQNTGGHPQQLQAQQAANVVRH